MGNLASLTLRLGADISQFQTNMRKAANVMRKTGAQMKSIGKNMSMYVTGPIVAMAGASLAAFDKQAQAERKLAAQIRANGKDVDTTLASYKAFATQLQDITTVGDETTLQLMQMAETMQSTNVEEATKGAIGLSKALGVDLKAALKMTVLAQNGEYTMLNRYVPALRGATTETQKAAIVSKLYADGLKIAQEEAKTGLGPLKQLKNTLGDIMEQFGALVADAIKPAVEWLKQMADKFQQLSPQGKKTIAIMAAVAAAIGPVVMVLGTMLTVLPAIGAALAALTGPVGLVVAAIAAIAAAFIYVYGNWQAFKERLTNWSWLRNAAIDAFIALIKASSWMMNELAKVFGFDFVSPIVDSLEKLKVPVEGVKTKFKSFGQTFKDVAKEAMDAMGFLGSGTDSATSKMGKGLANSTKEVHKMTNALPKLKSRMIEVSGAIAANPIELPKLDTSKAIKEADTSIYNYETAVMDTWSQAIQNLKGLIANSLADVAIMIGEAIGDVISGLPTDIGKEFIAALGGFVKTVGKLLISFGTLILVMKTLEKAPTIPTAIAAIAAGVAAVAVGQVLMNTVKEGPGMAKGGIIPPGFSNDTYPARLSSGEMVVPAPKALPIGLGGNQQLRISGTLRGSGKDLYGVFDNYGRR